MFIGGHPLCPACIFPQTGVLDSLFLHPHNPISPFGGGSAASAHLNVILAVGPVDPPRKGPEPLLISLSLSLHFSPQVTSQPSQHMAASLLVTPWLTQMSVISSPHHSFQPNHPPSTIRGHTMTSVLHIYWTSCSQSTPSLFYFQAFCVVDPSSGRPSSISMQ